MQAVGNLPFNILASVLYCGIFYGMCGLRSGSLYFVKFTTVVTLLMLIAAQVRTSCLRRLLLGFVELQGLFGALL